MRYHIFISYVAEDQEIACQLVKKLMKFNISVCLRDFKLAENYNLQNDLEQGLETARYGIVILSPHVFKRKWVKRELLNIFSDRSKLKNKILPVFSQINPEEVKEFASLLNDQTTANNRKDILSGEVLKKIGEKKVEDMGYFDFLLLAKTIDCELNTNSYLLKDTPCHSLFTPLPSLLEKYDNFIDELLLNFDRQIQNQDGDPAIFMMQEIRRVMNAELIYYLRKNGNDYTIVYENNASHVEKNENFEAIQHFTKNFIFPDFEPGKSCFLKLDHLNLKGLKKNNCIAIPIVDHTEEALILILSFSEFFLLEDVIGIIFNSLYLVTNSFSKVLPEVTVRSAIYDEIKFVYKYVSNNMYNRRFRDFSDELKHLEMHFEPILHLSNNPDDIFISSWEALARPAGSHYNGLPARLFKAAELWGVQFQTELDLYCLRKSLETYMPQIAKRNERLPLSVNVYPDSILRTIYKKELEHLKKEKLLSSDGHLILEISEKTLATSLNGDGGINQYLNDFRANMNRLSHQYGVQFAIDDFGVGWASISRLNRLLPTYIKIDREILLFEQNLGKAVIRYLKGLSNISVIGGMKIIVEGVDELIKIPLSELVNELYVRYVQGHLLGKAVSNITSLTKKRKQEIARLINVKSPNIPQCPICGQNIS
ncbi:EAL domain-containing protein [candidate division KSB1 bacterium]|nr:EAL domain-containing protein [candidate division KSB1 bacterium]